MAQVTKTDLETMDYVYQGTPFVNVPAKNDIDLNTMDYVYQGEPLVSGVIGGVVTSYQNLLLMGVG